MILFQEEARAYAYDIGRIRTGTHSANGDSYCSVFQIGLIVKLNSIYLDELVIVVHILKHFSTF